MARRTTLVLAVISLTVALVLGAVDDETHDLGDLFAAQNLPAPTLVAVVAFLALGGCRMGLTALARRLAREGNSQERLPSS